MRVQHFSKHQMVKACPNGPHANRHATRHCRPSPQTQRLSPVLGGWQKLLDDMADELQELLTRSEVLGEQGDVDGSQAAAAQAEAVKVAPSTAC